jgi:hypothetical protein
MFEHDGKRAGRRRFRESGQALLEGCLWLGLIACAALLAASAFRAEYVRYRRSISGYSAIGGSPGAGRPWR